MKPERNSFTEEEHEKLAGPVNEEFCDELAAAVAKQLKKFPKEVRGYVKVFLQDRTSLFSPYTARLIDKKVGHTV